MAKQVKKIIFNVEDTENPGTPDRVTYSAQITDTTDESLMKRVSGEIDSPDFSKTLTQMFNDIKSQIETDEGIS